MPLSRIENISTPLVMGQDYLVPCGYMPCEIDGFPARTPIPIIGDLHQDPELDADFPHYHYDNRFIEEPIAPGRIVAVVDHGQDDAIIVPRRILYLKKRCYRSRVEFPEILAIKLQRSHQNCTLNWGYCPHRNAYLGNILPDTDGNVICPAHGLEWNLATGNLVEREEILELKDEYQEKTTPPNALRQHNCWDAQLDL